MDQRIANRAAGITNTRTPAKMVRGRPIVTSASRPFRGTADFQEQLIANRTDRSISKREQNAREAKLVARRRRQLGED